MPISATKSDSAIGVTYSCEKRTSVRAKNASPGFTAGTPSAPDLRVGDDVRGEDLLAERHRARGVVIAGGVVSPGEARAVVGEEAAVLDDARR